MTKSEVFVNYYDCICCAGNSPKELLESLLSQRSGITKEYFFGKEFGVGKIHDLDIEKELLGRIGYILEKTELENFKETLLLIGSSVGGLSLTEKLYFQDGNFKRVAPSLHAIEAISTKISKKYAFKNVISFSTACTSSANALGFAHEVIAKKIYKNVLVIGFDNLCQTSIGGFHSLGVLSEEICRPFDKWRNGMNVAEALTLLLVEEKKREKSIKFCGVGYSSDAHHMTQPSPDGYGAKIAMQNALAMAQLKPEDIDYINAHGTGTNANDKSEFEAIKSLFKTSVHVSSTKSITGHALGAAATLESIICCLSIEKQCIFPTFGLKEPLNEGVNFATKSLKASINYVLSNSFAFGGNNTSLVFGKKYED